MKPLLCQKRTCLMTPVRKEGRWWFCAQHAPLWRTHNRIVERILRIPPR